MSAATLDKLVVLRHHDLRSVNVERDSNSERALAGYLPSEEVLELLRRFLAAAESEVGGRAWSVTGPYGAGKSSAAHFLSSLLAPDSSPLYLEASSLLRDNDAALAERVDALRKGLRAHRRGFVRATVTARREPLTSALARALWGVL